MLSVVSYFNQGDISLMIKVHFSEVLGLQSSMRIPSYEDHGGCFVSFTNRVIHLSFNDSPKTLCSEVELHILGPTSVSFFHRLLERPIRICSN